MRNPNTIVPLFYNYRKVHTDFSNFYVKLLESLIQLYNEY